MNSYIYFILKKQWMLMIIALSILILALISSDVAQIIQSLKQQKPCSGMEKTGESIESMQRAIEHIEQRLSDLEEP